MASAAILLAILAIERLYDSQLDHIEWQIAMGLCAYLIAILLSNSVLIRWELSHLPSFRGYPPSVQLLEAWWNGSRFVVFDAVLAAWCLALRKVLPAPEPAPEMLLPGTYRELSPAINLHLRALNARLMDFLKT